MIPSYNCPQFKTTSLHALARANGRARDILKGDFTPLQGFYIYFCGPDDFRFLGYLCQNLAAAR